MQRQHQRQEEGLYSAGDAVHDACSTWAEKADNPTEDQQEPRPDDYLKAGALYIGNHERVAPKEGGLGAVRRDLVGYGWCSRGGAHVRAARMLSGQHYAFCTAHT